MSAGCDLVVLGGSWGGMEAIGRILGALPEDFPAPVLAVLHRAEDSTEMLQALLARRSRLPVREADDKDPLEPGVVLVAPAGYHLLVERGHVELSTEGAVRHSRPSIDLTLQTAADAYGAGVAGIVLTGANDDGAAGLAVVRRRGGTAIVQDPKTAERRIMPAAAIRAAAPQAVRALDEIPDLLVRLVRGEEGA